MGYGVEPEIGAEGRRPPTPRMMEAFNAVMEAGSVSAAARCLGVSQPAVSRLLKQFEEELGFALFHRAKGKLMRSEEHTSELQSLMRISYAVFCLKKKTKKT